MKWRLLSPLLFLLGSAVIHAEPLSLSTAWQAAQHNDPTYKAAIAEREAGQTERALGRAALLPQISGSIGRTRMDGDLDTPDARGNVVRQDLDYTSKINEISAQQMGFD